MNIVCWRLVLINQVFARTLTGFGLRCRIISVKLLVLGVKMLPLKIRVLLLKFINGKCSIYKNYWLVSKGFVPTSMRVFYNSVQFLACFYKIWCYLNLIYLFFQNIEISYNRYFASSRKWLMAIVIKWAIFTL